MNDAKPLVRTLAEVLAGPRTSRLPKVVVPQLAWRGRVTLLAAREKTGKSTLASAAAAAVSRGSPWLNDTTEAAAVLWAGFEEHEDDVAERFVRAGANPQSILLLDDERREDVTAQTILAVAAKEHHPALIVVDSLSAFVGRLNDRPEPGNATAWTPVMAALARVARENDAALLILHHARKSDGEYRDSSAIGAVADVIIHMSEGDADVRRLTVRARWQVRNYAVRRLENSFELVAGEAPLPIRVLRFISRPITPPGEKQRDRRLSIL